MVKLKVSLITRVYTVNVIAVSQKGISGSKHALMLPNSFCLILQFFFIFTCPAAAPILPVPSTIPVTVAKASLLPLRASCLPRSADMAELIMLDGPPMKSPVIASSTPFITWSLGDPERVDFKRKINRVNFKPYSVIVSLTPWLMKCSFFCFIIMKKKISDRELLLDDVHVLTAVSHQGSDCQHQTDDQHRRSLPHKVRDQTLKCSSWYKK